MRYVHALLVIVAITGVLLAAGSLFTVPYSVRNEIKVERKKTWIDETFILPPNTNRSYLLDSVFRNTSIFQIDTASSSLTVFRIINDDENKQVFEWQEGGIFFWTPPSFGYDLWRFVFHNPSSIEVSVTAKVTEYYLKVRDYETIVQYRTVLDVAYGYAGLGLIIATVVFNAAYISRLENRNKGK